ncbi:MAG: hypothetical protein IKG40_04915 [Bacilli bacterium]|nr:hypothetical protein [Bacilli bacterium]
MKKYRKQIKIGLIVLFILLIISMVWLFIVPSFRTNKYGDRLKEINKHKITKEVIDKIKDKSSSNDSVLKIDYHKEGRILNFTVTVDSNFGVDQAKEFINGMIGEIIEDDQKYYDIQVFVDSNDKSDNYPIIGYKNKNSDKIVYGNVGG